MVGKMKRGGGGKRGGLRGNGSRFSGGGLVRGVGGAVGGFGRGGLGLAPTGGKVRKDRTQRFGKLVNEKDQIEHGQYIPWARAQTPGSVKEVQFNAESREAYLTGFRKRKAERQVVAKKTVSTKEKNEIRKGRRDRKRELMGKYEDRVAQMKKIADEAKRLEKLKELGLPLPSDDDRSGDDDVEEAEQEIEDESEDEELPCSTIKKVMKFGDSRTGTATTVEVREMDLSELHESASSFSSLPALPKADHTKISKKHRNPSRGRQRQLKKDKLAKSKRDKRSGSRGKGAGGG